MISHALSPMDTRTWTRSLARPMSLNARSDQCCPDMLTIVLRPSSPTRRSADGLLALDTPKLSYTGPGLLSGASQKAIRVRTAEIVKPRRGFSTGMSI